VIENRVGRRGPFAFEVPGDGQGGVEDQAHNRTKFTKGPSLQAAFGDQGYLVHEALLGGTELDELRAVTEEVAASFRERFLAKGRFAAHLEKVAIHVITHPMPGLLGAAVALRRQSHEESPS